MNYNAVIKQHAWFIDSQERVWVITALTHDWNDKAERFNEQPYQVNLLQVKENHPIARPWDEIVDLIERGLMRELI